MNKLICRGQVSLVLWQAILGQGMGKETRAKQQHVGLFDHRLERGSNAGRPGDEVPMAQEV